MSAAIPLAVAASVRTPGMYVGFNFTAEQSSVGSAQLKCLCIAQKGSTGTITADTQLVEGLSGPDAGGTYLGVGTKGHLALKALFKECPLAAVDLVSPLAGAGSASATTVTFSGTPTVTWDVYLWISGRTIHSQWVAGSSATDGATALKVAIALQNADLPVTADNSSSAVLTVTFKDNSYSGNDVALRLTYANGATGTVTLAAAAPSGASSDPSLTNVLGLVTRAEYDFILLCGSNHDAALASGSMADAIKTHISTYLTGLNAKLQQLVYGSTDTVANAKTGTAGMNFACAQLVLCRAGESLPCEWAGAEVGARMREVALKVNKNRIGMPYVATLYNPASLKTSDYSAPEAEDLLYHGVTPVTFVGTTYSPAPMRPITTYYADALGNADSRVLDVTQVDGIFAVTKDLRVTLPDEFKGANLSPDLPIGADPLPEGVVEEKDVKSFTNSRVMDWVAKGVVSKAKYLAALLDGSFVCQVDPSDASQCDIVLPIGIVPPFAKFSLYVNHVQPN